MLGNHYQHSFTSVQFKSCFSYKNDVFKGWHSKNYSWINDSKRAEMHTAPHSLSVLKKPEGWMVFFVLVWRGGGVHVILAPDVEGKKNPKGAVRAAVQRWERPRGGWTVVWAAASAGAVLTSSVSEDSSAGALQAPTPDCSGHTSHQASGCFSDVRGPVISMRIKPPFWWLLDWSAVSSQESLKTKH